MAALGGAPEDWWANRAPLFTRGIDDPAATPPSGLPQIVERLERTDTLIDVGAGAGRYSVPLTQTLGHVTLVEPSPAMAGLAREQLEATGRANWTLIEDGWLDAKAEPASALLMANVLNPHEDLEDWITKALDHAQEWLFIVHGSIPDAMDPLRQVAIELHGEPRIPQPGLSDLLPALHELGVYPDVAMFERRFARRYESREAAAREVASTLLIEPTPDALRRIRTLLRRELRTLPDGGVAMPAVLAPHALLTWRTAGRPRGRWQMMAT